jgi:hypothetical protein
MKSLKIRKTLLSAVRDSIPYSIAVFETPEGLVLVERLDRIVEEAQEELYLSIIVNERLHVKNIKLNSKNQKQFDINSYALAIVVGKFAKQAMLESKLNTKQTIKPIITPSSNNQREELKNLEDKKNFWSIFSKRGRE